jgi:signal transduction histidine kinase
MPELSDEAVRGFCADDEHFRIIRELGTRSGMVVPLVARGQVLGALTVGSADRRYGPADLELAKEEAQRAAIAIDNSRLYRDSQRAVRVREEFLMVAAHELRTPFTSLQLQIQSLQQALERGRAGTPEEQGRRLTPVRRQVTRLVRLVDTLLDVSQIRSGQFDLDRETIDLAELVGKVTDEQAQDLARAGCTLELELHPVTGRWDRMRIEQVLTNLLANAMKFGAGKPIEIALTETNGNARLCVRDRGIGIDPARQDRIYERFGRAVSERHYGGLGLGLYTSRRIVEAHDGTIRVESQLGAGATFIVELPREVPRSKENAPTDPATGPADPRGTS